MRPDIHQSSVWITDTGRRTFLKAGIAGSALLIAGRWLAPAYAAQSETTTSPFKYLTAADAEMLGRVVPVVLQGSLPKSDAERKTAIAETISGIDFILGYQPAAARKEAADLFGLLTTSATRALVAGIWKSWDKATDDDITRFLNRWRDSRFSLLQSAYIGLHNLIIGSWYGNPRSWTHAGYGGPARIA